MDSTRNNLLEALKQVERRTENSASGWRLLLYAATLIPFGLAIVDIATKLDTIGGVDLKKSVAALAALLLLAFALHFGHVERRLIRARLESGNVAQRIANGELLDDPIFEATPWPWRLFLPGGRTRSSLENVIRRVAWNLDWYLRPTTRLWRWLWVVTPLALILIVVNLLWQAKVFSSAFQKLSSNASMSFARWYFLSSAPEYVHNGLLLQTLVLTLTLLIPLSFFHYRRQIWTEELVRHLRQRLQA